MVLDEGIVLHGKVSQGLKKDGAYSNAIKSCLFTRFSLKHKTDRDRFWERLPTKFEEYAQATIANEDRIRTADHQCKVEDGVSCRDATFVRVSSYWTLHSTHQSDPHSTRFSGTCLNIYRAENQYSSPLSTSVS